MATIKSPWVGSAAGKLGDAVYYRSQGATRARALAGSVKNPKSFGQLKTRIILATAARAYSYFRSIADHSFQNFSYGARNQQRFMALNTALLRAKLDNTLIQQLAECNYNAKNQLRAVVNPYIISEGSLPSIGYAFNEDETNRVMFNDSNALAGSYADVANRLSVPLGGQLTFIVVEKSIREVSGVTRAGIIMNPMHVARVILMPADGDASKSFLTGGTGAVQLVNDPNPKNEGKISFNTETVATFNVDAVSASDVAMAAIISSAYVNGKWERSSQSFVTSPDAPSVVSEPFGEAYESYKAAVANGDSDRYLNEGE